MSHAYTTRVIDQMCQIVGCRCEWRESGAVDKGFAPQPGFIGGNYGRTRVLLLGQNPGYAGDGDKEAKEGCAYALWRIASETRRLRDFEAVMHFLREYMNEWPIIRRLHDGSELARLLPLDEVAYTNILKCKTRPGAKVRPLMRSCLTRVTDSQIDLLGPRRILCLGKDVYRALEGTRWQGISTWVYHPSGSRISSHVRRQQMDEACKFLRQGGKGGVVEPSCETSGMAACSAITATRKKLPILDKKVFLDEVLRIWRGMQGYHERKHGPGYKLVRHARDRLAAVFAETEQDWCSFRRFVPGRLRTDKDWERFFQTDPHLMVHFELDRDSRGRIVTYPKQPVRSQTLTRFLKLCWSWQG